ncbi:MAG: CoA transferase [Rhodospirillales bacterium]|nr:CoA transferase [Rhodospirillales bacterium]
MLERTLSGVKILDLTQNVAGPFCTQILGDMGAEVIKVERPGRGDDTRDWRPPEIGGLSATFLSLNRSKTSICIDLDHASGQTLLRELAAQADVIIHSLKPGSAEQRGFGYEDLKAVNPRLIYCAISAFGQTGPLSGLPGYDPLVQAFTGIMSVTGQAGDDPVRVGVSLIDLGTGMWAAMGVMAALIQRKDDGQGRMVEASLLETGIAWMTIPIAGYLANGQLPRKMGSGIAITAPYELFRSADSYVFVAAGNDRLFQKVCAALGQPEIAQDPRFLSNPLRVANREALHQAIEAITLTMPTAESVRRLRGAGAPCSEMNDVSQALAHEQVKAAGIVEDLPVEGVPQHKVVAMPLKMNGARAAQSSPPPALGADTETVLAALGYSHGDIAQMRQRGIVA